VNYLLLLGFGYTIVKDPFVATCLPRKIGACVTACGACHADLGVSGFSGIGDGAILERLALNKLVRGTIGTLLGATGLGGFGGRTGAALNPRVRGVLTTLGAFVMIELPGLPGCPPFLGAFVPFFVARLVLFFTSLGIIVYITGRFE
jgi:hypothetical protein